jgi:hypothetical protein
LTLLVIGLLIHRSWWENYTPWSIKANDDVRDLMKMHLWRRRLLLDGEETRLGVSTGQSLRNKKHVWGKNSRSIRLVQRLRRCEGHLWIQPWLKMMGI